MTVTRHNFMEVSVTGTRRWKTEDGRKKQRTKKFFQTLSPFNKTAEGVPKTREQIMLEIVRERNLWLVKEE
jgi:hypothetical protein